MVPAGSDAARRWPCSTTATSGQAGTGSIDKPVPRLHDLEWLPRGAGRPRGPPAPPLRYAGDDVRDPAGIEGSARICSRVVVSVCAVMSPASSAHASRRLSFRKTRGLPENHRHRQICDDESHRLRFGLVSASLVQPATHRQMPAARRPSRSGQAARRQESPLGRPSERVLRALRRRSAFRPPCRAPCRWDRYRVVPPGPRPSARPVRVGDGASQGP
jgi:hypothetical protein